MEQLRDKVAKGLFWGAVNSGSTQLLQLVIGIFLLRMLSPSDYGIVGMLTIFTAIAGNLQDSGFSTALINLKSIKDKDYNAVFWFSLIVSLSCYAVLFFCAPLIARFFHQPVLVPLSRIVFLSFIFAALGIPHSAYMMRNFMNKEKAIIGFVALVVSGTVSIAMALYGMGYWSLVAQQMIFIIVLDLGRFYYTRWMPSFHIDFTPIRQMFGFSNKILITSIVNTVSNNILTVIFGRLFSARTLGFFTQAYKWDTMAYALVSNTIGQVAQPTLANVREEHDREKRVLRKMTRFTALLSFPAMFGLAIIAREVTIVAIGSKWAESIPLLQILCMGGAFFPFFTLYQNLAISHFRSDIFLWCNIGQIIIQIAIVLLSYPYGIKVMVAAYAAFNILWLLVWHFATFRLSGLRLTEVLKDILPFMLIAAFSMAVAIVVTLPLHNVVLLLIAKITVAAAVYIAIMKLLKVKIFNECLDYFSHRR